MIRDVCALHAHGNRSILTIIEFPEVMEDLTSNQPKYQKKKKKQNSNHLQFQADKNQIESVLLVSINALNSKHYDEKPQTN